jgi:hypothetical protein
MSFSVLGKIYLKIHAISVKKPSIGQTTHTCFLLGYLRSS